MHKSGTENQGVKLCVWACKDWPECTKDSSVSLVQISAPNLQAWAPRWGFNAGENEEASRPRRTVT